MANYQPVSTRLWQDPKVRSWSNEGKLLATYLLTCHHRSTEGLFFLPRAYMAADLGWSEPQVTEVLSELGDFALYDDDAQVVLILNALRYQTPTGVKQVKGAWNRLEGVPATSLWTRFVELVDEHAPDLADELAENPIPHQPVHREYPTDTEPKGYPPSNSSSCSSSNSSSGSGSARRRATQLPDGWRPDDVTNATLAKQYPDIDLDRELAQFTDHARSKGRTAKDWTAAWRMWVRKADEWRRERAGPAEPARGQPPAVGSPEWEARQREQEARAEALAGGDG